jgi:hypothetical protein
MSVTPQPATPTTEVAATPAKDAPAVETAASKDGDFLSPKFAALSRKEKALRAEQRKFEEERKAWQAQKQTQDAELESAKSWKTRLAQDPYGVMLESGLTADQVAALMMNQPDPKDQQLTLVQKEMAAIKKAQEDLIKQQQEAQTQAYQDALKQISADVKSLVDSNDEYETIRAWGRHQDVVDLIEATYKADGRLMTNEEAAKEVEDYLVEEALKFTQLKKIQAKLAPAAPTEAAALKTETPAQKTTANTLTNRMGQATAAKPMTARERRERAILAFQGKLQS